MLKRVIFICFFLHLQCVDAKKTKVGGMRMRQDVLKHLVEICASNLFSFLFFLPLYETSKG